MNSAAPSERTALGATLALCLVLPQDPSWNLLPDRRPAVRKAAFDAAADSRDPRWLSPLIDLLAFAETPDEWYAVLDAAGAILGEDLRSVQRPWRTLTTRLSGPAAPPSFEDPWGWKRELLVQRVDPRFADLLPPGTLSNVPPVEVVWGGVGVMGIPALVDSPTLTADQASYLRDDEPVFGVWIGGEARAYPQRILDWHEMAVDTVGGVPVALAYCTLCGAAVLYDRRLGERTFDFRTSGLLQHSNKLMLDLESNSLWNQLTGEPVIGPLASSGLRLTVLPVVTTTWGRWRAEHPQTRVLDRNTGFDRDYSPGAAYGDYYRSPETMFPALGVGPGQALEAKQRTVVVRLGTRSAVFPLEELVGKAVHNRSLEGDGILLIVDEPSGPEASWPGWGDQPLPAAVRVYARGDFRFEASSPSELVDERGEPWTITESALVGPAGERLDRLPSHGAHRFAWGAFFAPVNEPIGVLPAAEDE